MQWFVYAQQHGNNISHVCEHFGISRSTFHRWAKAFDPNDLSTLESRSTAPHKVRKPTTSLQDVALIRQYREHEPLMSKERIAQDMLETHGIQISPASIGRVIQRFNLYFADTPSHRLKRLKTEIESTHHVMADYQTEFSSRIEAVLKQTDSPASPGLGVAASFLIALASSLFIGVPSTQALEGSNYQVHVNTSNTQIASPLVGSNYQAALAPSNGSDGGDTGGDTGGGSTGGDTGGSTGGGGAGGGRRDLPTDPGATPGEADPVGSDPLNLTKLHEAAPRIRQIPDLSTFRDPSGQPALPTALNFGYLDPQERRAIAALDPRLSGAASWFSLSNLHQEINGLYASLLNGSVAQRSGDYTVVMPFTSMFGLWIFLALVLVGLLFFFLGASVFMIFCFAQYGSHCVHFGRMNIYLPNISGLFRQSAKQGRPKSKLKTKRKRKRSNSAKALILATLATWALSYETVEAGTTIPLTTAYNGHLLDSAGDPITTAHTFRFSWWTSADFVSSDLTATGAINTSATNYVGWFEEHTLTPTADGSFAISLGSGTALPTLDSLPVSTLTSLYNQLEVKVAGAADSTYDLLDSNSSNPNVDRAQIQSSQFAQNADLLDQRDTGTASGSIPVLGTGGSLTLDNGSTTSGSIVLEFGKTLAKQLKYDIENSRFDFNAHVNIQGGVIIGDYEPGTGTGAGTIRWTGADFEGYDGSEWASLTSGAGGGGSAKIQESDVTVVNTGSTIDFYGVDFDVTESPANEANIFLSTGGLIIRLNSTFVNVGGDTMTGDLVLGGGAGLTASGSLRTASGIVLNYKNAAQDVPLVFGHTLGGETLKFLNAEHRFEFSDDVHVTGNLTASGNLTVTGNMALNSVIYTFPGSDGAASGRVLTTDGSGNLSWALIGTGSLATRTKQIYVPIDTTAITIDGTDNQADVYVGSQTGSTADPHQYYRVTTGSGQLQDVDIRVKVKLPTDFVDFSDTSDLSFYYKNTGASSADSKLDILVEDNDGDDAFTAADGEALFNTAWTEYTDEFDGGSFDPVAQEYIYVIIKGYATSNGEAFAGEVVLTYVGR